jgi:hypothetical protein
MKKVHLLVLKTTMEVETRDGRSLMSIKLTRLEPRASIKNLVSTSIDHSTLFLNYHSIELLRCTVTLMSTLRDGETMQDNNNSGSMNLPRLSKTTTGRTTALIFKMHHHHNMVILEHQLQLDQDGGNCSRKTEISLSTKEEVY